MHYAEQACHSRPGSFPFKCEPESIKRNELQKPGYYLSVYPLRLFYTTPGVTRCRNGGCTGKIFTTLQSNCFTLKRDVEFSDSITINKKNDRTVKLL